jgi:protein required for attachment to host cells
MTKPLRTLFIVADGAHARVVRRNEGGEDFVTVRELTETSHTHAGPHELASGSSGQDRFPSQIAEAVNHEVEAGHVERLALVGPARIVAAINRHLTHRAQSLLARTLAKDLSKTPDHELARWLRGLELG